MRQSRKKRRSQQQPTTRNDAVSRDDSVEKDGESEEELIINNLVEAFSLNSVEEAQAAYREANGDPIVAADILTDRSEAYEASCSSSNQSWGTDTCSSLSSSSSSSDGLRDSSSSGGGNKGKKVVASAGTISSHLGKHYVSDKSRNEVVKEKGFGGGGGGGKFNVEEAEQFLCSMLGDDSELSMAVVKDVLCSCGYEVEKASEVLLNLSASPSELSANDKYSNSNEYSRNMDFSDNFWQLSDRGSDSNSYSSESDSQDNLPFFNYTNRNYVEALLSSDSSRKLAAASQRTNGDELPQQLLESLFNMPKSAEHEPSSTMNWKNVVKQMESFAQKSVRLGRSRTHPQQMINEAVVKGAEYHMFRGTARQRWDETRSCYQKAAAAYANGEKNYATYMSEQGKQFSKMAREADEKASMEIFKARNQGIENSLTIDLHGQHVKQAMRVVKLHLLFATYISSVQYIRVITGCGSRGLGKSVVKQSVVNLLVKEKVPWMEENQGTVLIKLDGPREFSFLDSESGSDTE